MPAPTVVPTPTLGAPVAKAAIDAMTSQAALPTARKVTPATCAEIIGFRIRDNGGLQRMIQGERPTRRAARITNIRRHLQDGYNEL